MPAQGISRRRPCQRGTAAPRRPRHRRPGADVLRADGLYRKTAFDAEFAKYFPGALLVDKVTKQQFSMPGIEAIDSCSSETGLMGQLWSGRRSMVDLLIDVGPTRSVAFRLEAARELGYERLRDLRNRLRGWRWPAKSKKVAAAPQN